ncbi:hypothetical protein KCU92_g8127, partial [Aureobasidium melanogenum]
NAAIDEDDDSAVTPPTNAAIDEDDDSAVTPPTNAAIDEDSNEYEGQQSILGSALSSQTNDDTSIVWLEDFALGIEMDCEELEMPDIPSYIVPNPQAEENWKEFWRRI